MRHRVKGRKLGRRTAHREAMLQGMVAALIAHERVTTTEAKARELQGLAEKLITKGRGGSLHLRRQALAVIPDKDAVGKLFGALAERYKDRPGGYTRVLKAGFRYGDSAPMAIIAMSLSRSISAQGAVKGPETKTTSRSKTPDAASARSG